MPPFCIDKLCVDSDIDVAGEIDEAEVCWECEKEMLPLTLNRLEYKMYGQEKALVFFGAPILTTGMHEKTEREDRKRRIGNDRTEQHSLL